MKDRIRYSLIYMGVIAALFAVFFTTRVFEGEMAEQLKGHLRENLRLIETSYKGESLGGEPQKLAKFASKDLRITLVDSKGGILYDSDAEAAKMENHNDREEIIDAFAKGVGEDLRYSSTLQAQVFYFAKRLSDGNVLRLGMRQANLQKVYSKTIPYLVVLLAAIVAAAILIAIGLSRTFVSPLKKLVDQLGTPEWMKIENVYKEIAPLVNTIRKQDLELQLTIEQLSNEKQKMAHLKDEFTANASHELKTPLTSISGYAELIESGMAKPEDVKTFAGKIHKEANRLQSIANDIITLSKLDNHGGEPFELGEKVNLWNVAHSCVESLGLNASKKSISLSLEGETSAEIIANSKLLYEMIFNLVDNAIRYTESGGKVVVLVEQGSIAVKDTGIGIPEECQSRMLGENIGTTITANIVALSANTQARRAALAHFTINVIGVIWVVIVLKWFLAAVCGVVGFDLSIHMGEPGYEKNLAKISVVLASFHSAFNVSNTFIQIWFIKYIEKFVCKVIKPKNSEEEEDSRLHFISSGLMGTPELSLLEARKEISLFATRTRKMFNFVPDLLTMKEENDFVKLFARIEKYEGISDNMEIEIAKYLNQVSEGRLSPESKTTIQAMLREISEIESTSACAVTVVKDFFGDADEPYKVGYIVDVFYADSTLNPNDSGLTPVLPKPVVSLLQVEVSGRNVAVTGLLENRPVMVFDMRGRMVASARFHGTSVNLMIPKSGRYLVRSGKQSRLIVVR